jgi:hypothetical protein
MLERTYGTGLDFGPLFFLAFAGRLAKARAFPFFGTGHAPLFLCFAARFGMSRTRLRLKVAAAHAMTNKKMSNDLQDIVRRISLA